jgi:hypothetical protein
MPFKQSKDQQQHLDDDIAFLQSILGDREHWKQRRKILPQLKFESKSLSAEIAETLSSSGNEFTWFSLEANKKGALHMAKTSASRFLRTSKILAQKAAEGDKKFHTSLSISIQLLFHARLQKQALS